MYYIYFLNIVSVVEFSSLIFPQVAVQYTLIIPPDFLLLGIYPSELRTSVPLNIYMQIFIALLFVPAKNQKPPKSYAVG